MMQLPGLGLRLFSQDKYHIPDKLIALFPMFIL